MNYYFVLIERHYNAHIHLHIKLNEWAAKWGHMYLTLHEYAAVNAISIIAADALAPIVSRSSAVMILTLNDREVPVINKQIL